MRALVCVYRSGDDFLRSLFFCYQVGPGDRILVVRLNDNCLYLLSHLACAYLSLPSLKISL